jgi:hypothetical protein
MFPSLNFSLLPEYRKSCFKIMQPEYNLDMKEIMYQTEGYELQILYPDAL